MKRAIRIAVIAIYAFLLTSCGLLGKLDLYKSIDFDSNFGTSVESIIKLPGTSVSEPETPTREHYTFGGWYIDRDFNEEFVFDKMPSDSVLLYAKWNGDILQTEDGLRLLLKDNGEYGVEGYVGTNPNLVIPESYNDIPITSIEILAFEKNDTIENISIPNTIKLIRHGAFNRVSSLQRIIIPSSVIELEDFLFTDSQSISYIGFESNSELECIGEYAFAMAPELITVELPASIEVIGDYAFLDSNRLKYIIFGSEDHLTTIGKGAFAHTNLDFIIIPASVTTIGESAFSKYSQGTTNIYARVSSKPSSWDETCFGSSVEVEWGSSRTQIMVTYQEPDGTILFITINISGTPYTHYTPGDIDGEFVGWYSDLELTQPLNISVYPEESFIIYGKILPFD